MKGLTRVDHRGGISDLGLKRLVRMGCNLSGKPWGLPPRRIFYLPPRQSTSTAWAGPSWILGTAVINQRRLKGGNERRLSRGGLASLPADTFRLPFPLFFASFARTIHSGAHTLSNVIRCKILCLCLMWRYRCWWMNIWLIVAWRSSATLQPLFSKYRCHRRI